jgi:hypothetical protein
MRPMKPPTTGQPPAADRSKIDPHRTRIGDGTGEPYVHHYKSVKMPGVAKGPILPESVSKFLRTRFRRKHTAAARH